MLAARPTAAPAYDREARARMRVYIGDVPETMRPLCVLEHLEMNGYGRPQTLMLSEPHEGLMQEGIVTFWSEADSTNLRQAGGQNRPALLWPDGRCAVIRPALRIGIIPGDRHHKAGGYAAQNASKRQFCGCLMRGCLILNVRTSTHAKGRCKRLLRCGRHLGPQPTTTRGDTEALACGNF